MEKNWVCRGDLTTKWEWLEEEADMAHIFDDKNEFSCKVENNLI